MVALKQRKRRDSDRKLRSSGNQRSFWKLGDYCSVVRSVKASSTYNTFQHFGYVLVLNKSRGVCCPVDHFF
ncbi:hypothetical protein Y032_1485g3894 [Ancylostoma ceylanicum]|uniref:Uncharacterized protein n=1 Tax=Ancylostoma ceylanicum TaxID=53326 RepID=A0A016W537_9BILA|nr:hypothetical protein Y032_1485g3894 [Ancylostoma ceylanicum]